MEFYEYPTTRDILNRSGLVNEKAEAFYNRKAAIGLFDLGNKSCAIQMISEKRWELNRRPYYNVYPAIAPMLLRLNLNVDTSLVHLPLPYFCIRLPKQKSPLQFQWEGEPWHVHSILVGPTTLEKDQQTFDGFTLWIDTGETGISPDGLPYPIHTYINLPLQKGITLEQSLKALPYDSSAYYGMILPEDIRTACARLACTLCLLENDPELIEPDVLSKDRAKYDLTHDAKYAEKARRRGKFGFNIGRGIEVIPHIRRPHPALVWTGHGRVTPKIIMRKGSIVHRDIALHVPTGFQGIQGG
jgi:hypothetical protein